MALLSCRKRIEFLLKSSCSNGLVIGLAVAFTAGLGEATAACLGRGGEGEVAGARLGKGGGGKRPCAAGEGTGAAGEGTGAGLPLVEPLKLLESTWILSLWFSLCSSGNSLGLLAMNSGVKAGLILSCDSVSGITDIFF